MNVDVTKARSIFTEAVENYPPDQWNRFLDGACGNDPALRRRVELLLKAHQGEDSFLDHGDVEGAASPTLDRPITEQPGTQIGPYKLLQQIGEGGMGVVYMAEQKEPVERRVALKIIKPGMDTRQVIARFEAERQALAMMDHPNIAKVLDAGTMGEKGVRSLLCEAPAGPSRQKTPDPFFTGRPYFVMELVNGIPVTQFCDEQHLTTRERLELFIPICQAVQHAHQKGIIHRDIKPSNILMALYDGRPVPKIIDFGVAKATGVRLTEKTMFTGLGQIVGTIEYMSPEQANRNQLDIDTRSDVYSLGVVLYELLTGDTPFDKQRLRSAAIDELLRIIREEEPPKPSTKLSSSDTLASVAANRHIEPAKLSVLVRGELDWIVMKTLEKDRARRYESASSLAADVQHYLNDEAVAACPPSAGYRFRKFATRNKAALAAGAAILLTLIGGVIGTTWQAARATRQRDRSIAAEALAEARLEAETRARKDAQNAERRATAESVRSGQIARFMKDMLQAVDPDVALGQDTTLLRGILDSTAERLNDELVGQPEVEAELRLVLGTVYRDLGEFKQSEAMDRRAIELNRKLFGREHVKVAESMYDLALTLTKQRYLAEAESVHREALAMRRKLLGSHHALVAQSLDDLGWALHYQNNKNAEAEAVFREALAVRKDLFGNEDVAVAESLSSLACLLRVVGRLSESEQLHREALTIRRKAFGNEHPKVANSLNGLANLLRDQGRLQEAEGMHREALSMRRKIYGNEHPRVAQSLTHLAWGLLGPGRRDEANKLLEEALAVQKRVLGLDHPDTALTISSLANGYYGVGQLDKAREQYETLVAIRRRAIELDPKDAKAHGNLGIVLAHEGKLDEAIACFRQAIELDPKSAGTHNNLGILLAGEGKVDEAVACFRRAIELDPKSAGTHNNLGILLAGEGKLDEAVTCFRQAIEIAPRQPLAHNNLGYALARLGKLDEAIAEYREAIDCYRQAIELDSKNTMARNNLVNSLVTRARLYIQQEAWDKAATDWATAVDLSEISRAWPSPRQDVCREIASWPEVFRRVAELRPGEPAVWIGRGQYRALRSQWTGAASDYARADPSQSIADETYQYAGLLLLSGDEPGYRKYCAELSALADEPAFLLARSCAIGPESGVNPSQLLEWAKQGVTEKENAWELHVLGLAQYRAGQLEDAIQSLEKSNSGNWPAQAKAQNDLVLAMVFHRQGDTEKAQQRLQQANAAIQQIRPEQAGEPVSVAVPDWIGLQVLRREAEALIDQIEDGEPEPHASRDDESLNTGEK